jgi:hypothetical protein
VITLDDYWMGRDKTYAADLTADIARAAAITVQRANALLAEFRFDTGDVEQRKVNSGWRPPEVNKGTPGAALRSKHMTGEAVDIADPDGHLDEWCLSHLDTLARLGLWLEHPSATKNWCHVQTCAPRSGNRCFFP